MPRAVNTTASCPNFNMFDGLASDEEPRLEDDEPTSVAPSNRFLTSEMPSLLWTILVKSEEFIRTAIAVSFLHTTESLEHDRALFFGSVI
jgi:hypothetical protein